jgi:hypothetical protein
MTDASLSVGTVPARARELAARLAALFERDVEIVGQLNDAQQRLHRANDRLWSGLAPDAFGLIYDGAATAGHSQIATLIEEVSSGAERGSRTAVLKALQDAHWQLHRGFCQYQSACQERRQLAFDVGELSQQLTEALTGAGFSAEEARNADVHQLAVGIRPTTGDRGGSGR